MLQCFVDGCEREIHDMAMCKEHCDIYRTFGTRKKILEMKPRPGKPVEPIKRARKPKLCSADECENLVVARGLCDKHYQQARNDLKGVKRRTRRDFTGQMIGELLVVGPDGDKWLCRCSCGKEFLRQHKKLAEAANHGHASTCGHFDARDAITNQQYASYSGGASARLLEFQLTKDDVGKIIFQPCHWCGNPLDKEKHGINFVGIDRKDNKLGYSVENCVPCCRTCNVMKRDMDLTDWISWIRRVTNHNFPYTENAF